MMNRLISPGTRKSNLKKIQPVSTKGTQPLSRVKSSSAVTDDGEFFLFGGFDEDDNLDGTVYILDIKTNEWRTHLNDEIYREGHSSLYIGDNTILTYGGVPEEAYNTHYNHSQLLKYHVKDNIWEAIEPKGDLVPDARSRHAVCLSEDKTKMFVSGGLFRDDLNDPYGDLHIFDLKTNSWQGSREFIYRFDHFITHHDGKIWSFGGLTKDMAHVTDISWFDLQTNITGSIKINDLPKFDGDHIFMNSSYSNSSFLLDVVLPLFSMNSTDEPCIGLYDLHSLRWYAVLSGAFQPLLYHKWKHTFIHESKLYLLGYPSVSRRDDPPFDSNLKTILALELTDLGIIENFTRKRKRREDSMGAEFANLLEDTTFSDFEIIGIEGNDRPSLNSKFIERGDHQNILDVPFTKDRVNDVFLKAEPIKVHSTILLARWPHFKRMMTSGMQETMAKQLFIPEPIHWLKALMEFLYTNDVMKTDLDILSGLLILSNLYEIPKLRKFCIQHIYTAGFNLEGVIKLWSRAKLVNEEVLVHNAAMFCAKNWSAVISTEAFEELTKEEMIVFCREVNSGGSDSRTKREDSQDGFVLNRYPYTNSTNGFGTGDSLPNFGISRVYRNYEQDEPKDHDDEYNSSHQLYERSYTPQDSVADW